MAMMPPAAADEGNPTAISINATLSTIVSPRMVIINTNDQHHSVNQQGAALTPQQPLQQHGIECSLHTLPKPLLREFDHVFGQKYNTNREIVVGGSKSQLVELLAIPTNQHAREDIVGVGIHIEEEKDRLLRVFMAFASEFCNKIRSLGYWSDFMDPCSGLPMLTPDCNKVYSEVDGMEVLLGYRTYDAGFCKILTHPKWGSAVYPSTIFANAPKSVVKKILESYPTAAAK
mmetsp:Transcript_2714/g.3158  ORF Transcript_2714/g.3158 Transcript_2714/m.3158 type:complete len:231 (-) Transcript_2714:242-934(-)